MDGKVLPTTVTYLMQNDMREQLLQLLQQLNIPYEEEHSFKLSEGTFVTDRYLIAVQAVDLNNDQLAQIRSAINFPPTYEHDFISRLGDANRIGIGFESSAGLHVHKLYLEFWDKLCNDIEHNSLDERVGSAVLYPVASC